MKTRCSLSWDSDTSVSPYGSLNVRAAFADNEERHVFHTRNTEA